jgi:hypothetical protein
MAGHRCLGEYAGSGGKDTIWSSCARRFSTSGCLPRTTGFPRHGFNTANCCPRQAFKSTAGLKPPLRKLIILPFAYDLTTPN